MNGMNLVEKSLNRLRLPGVIVLLKLMDWVAKSKWIFSRDKVVFKKDQTSDQNIHVVLALFEKDYLRKDIINLCDVLVANKCYVTAVNTKKLDTENIEIAKKYFGKYIERFNYGRDFSSYKTGVKSFYRDNGDQKSVKLLFLNDSVFYSKRGLDEWVKELINSEIPVTGTTENLEVEHHIGSFTLAVMKSVFMQKRFRKYWFSYKDTDLRAQVIKKGELKFSKVLKKCISSLTYFRALYNSERFYHFIKSDSARIFRENFSFYNRRSALTGLGLQIPTLDLNQILQYMRRFVVEDRDLEDAQNLKASDTSEGGFGKSLKILNEKDFNFIVSAKDLKQYLNKNITNEYERALIDEEVDKAIIFGWHEIFRQGSQIHTNCIILSHMGVPFIKLDLIFRGVCAREDIKALTSNLPEDEVEDLINMLYSRPFGETSLFGWRKTAFMNGLI